MGKERVREREKGVQKGQDDWQNFEEKGSQLMDKWESIFYYSVSLCMCLKLSTVKSKKKKKEGSF